MRGKYQRGANDTESAAQDVELKEIVMGLHWHPQESGARSNDEPANLDALCVLFDQDGSVLEVVHPGHPSNVNGSVLHTGDSRTGASEWDDERIFVFLEALPDSVYALDFIVTSANGHVFSEVPGAFCHVSDRVTEHEWIGLDLTQLSKHKEHRIATLRRSSAGWQLSSDARRTHAT
jgi:stress response protein SCP2